MDSVTIPARNDDHVTSRNQVLDHYVIEEFVARGGMADIFRATDWRTNQPVAIKIPHAEAQNDRSLMRAFEREERILQMFDHPGIVRVIREPDRTQRYMVMEWLEGRLLRDILNEHGKLPAERAVRIALSICDALESIHGDGVIHRDLKPENIMVDAEDRAKIIDFGIALTPASRRLTFSACSRAMGTPDYISPEQVKGKRGDRRSDVYALGMILYEMLSGQLAFPGANPLVVMNARLLSHPPPLRAVAPAISPQLESIVSRSLEIDPRKRYSSARNFASDLRNQLDVPRPNHLPTTQKGCRISITTRVWQHLGLAMIPLILFGLLLIEARKEASSPRHSSNSRTYHVAERSLSE